jgi:UTP--glucose-1-phosphate uridylyltransferase
MSSVLDEVDAGTRSTLERYGFDPKLFAELQAQVANGTLSPETNIVDGLVEPPQSDDLARLPTPGERRYEEAAQAGLEALGRGELAVVVLNGGMATRFGGVVKGIVEAVDGRSFLELKLGQVERVAKEVGTEIPVAAMNSFATDQATREFVARNGLPEPIFFSQFVSLRLNPDGTLFRERDGSVSLYSPGHGDFLGAFRNSGTLAALRTRGVRHVLVSNVDNLGARVDPAVLGAHLVGGRPITIEVVRKEAGDAGGAPAWVNGRPVLIEGLRFPPDFDQDQIAVFSTNTVTFELEALDAEYSLTWLYVEKTVAGRSAVQLEHLFHEISAELPSTYLEVPRQGPHGRFFPIKTPADLDASREALREMLAASVLSHN